MNVGVILVQIWCNTLCDDAHDIHDIARNHTKSHDKATKSHVFPRYSRYQTVLLKLEEISERHPQGVFCMASIVTVDAFSFFSFCGWLSLIPPRSQAAKTQGFVVRAKNSPPDCFLNALTVLEEIISTLSNTNKCSVFRSIFCLSL